ncbi:MAG: transporter substrate-binding domain-containing protein [Rhodocyclaceae bacterium]|nr:transporter substrate-binding domain-containing protein [Rhodocyclaceae bacterium]MBX3669355.1 transporter substrate-binding domain-containing protein [Rhodocyclaceae bacterium]
MRAILFLRLIVSLTAICMFAATAVAGETLALCVEKADVRPWRTQDGGGLNIDLLNRVAGNLGLRFDYRGMPWKRCLAELKANAVAGAIGASFKADRLELAVYPGGNPPDASKRLNVDRYVVLRRKGAKVDWDGKAFSYLDGAVGIQLGYSVGDQLRAMGVKVDEGTQKGAELLHKLAAGRLAAAAMLDGEAVFVLDTNPALAAEIQILPQPLVEKPYFLVFSHEFARSQADLAGRIWQAIATVRNSAEYQKLERDAQAAMRN